MALLDIPREICQEQHEEKNHRDAANHYGLLQTLYLSVLLPVNAVIFFKVMKERSSETCKTLT